MPFSITDVFVFVCVVYFRDILEKAKGEKKIPILD